MKHNTSDLSYVDERQTAGTDEISTSVTYHDSKFWVLNNIDDNPNVEVREYSDSWSLLKTHTVSAPQMSGPSTQNFDGITWIDNSIFLNPHGGTDPERLHEYHYDGTDFHFVRYIDKPVKCDQGIDWYETDGQLYMVDTDTQKRVVRTEPRSMGDSFFRGHKQDSTTDSLPDNLIVQHGWGYITGDNTGQIEETVTFPVAFSAPPVVIPGQLAAIGTGTTPDDTDDFTSNWANAAGCFAEDITSSSFEINLTATGTNTHSSSFHFGYTWIAIGPA